MNMKSLLQQKTGSLAKYQLFIEIAEANYDILNVLAGESSEDLEEAILEDDGKYHYKIGKVSEGFVKVVLASEKSTSKINGETDEIVRVILKNDITEVPIVVTGEDGTEKEYILVIEKKSSDTSIKSVTGEGVTNTEFKDDAIYVTVKEELEEIDLTITLNNKYGKLRLKAEEGEPEEEFEIYQITRKISLSSSLDSDSVTLTVTVMAEDGTEREQIIIITKDTDVALKTVEVNSEIIDYDKVNERYEAIVPNANKPEVVITAENELQTVMLIDSEGNTIASGIGKVNVTLNLSTEEL